MQIRPHALTSKPAIQPGFWQLGLGRDLPGLAADHPQQIPFNPNKVLNTIPVQIMHHPSL